MTTINGEAPPVTVEELQQQLNEAVWYVAELQHVLKALVAQMVVQQVGQTLQAQVAEQLKTGGFVGL